MRLKTVLQTLIATTLVLSAASASAQLDLPRPSPGAKVMQHVGLTDITVDYSSPGVKGRKIWGGVVPMEQLWRAGANAATKITFSKDVKFGGQPVPAGTYSLFVWPGQTWTVILNKNADASTGAYKKELDQVRVTAKTQAIAHRERMTFLFSDFTDDAASLDLEWEKVRISVPIKLDTEAQAMASIKGAVDNGWRPYANAARYMADAKKDYATALKYVDKSLAIHEDWFNDWTKAYILAAKGDHKQALGYAQKAYDLGKKAEVFFLEGEVKKALTEWKK